MREDEMAVPIGGYFELETPRGELPCEGGVAVNFGRGGLELILRTRQYRKVWIPDYICPCVPDYLSAIGMPFSTYEIGANLEPCEMLPLAIDEAFLYVNYFGVKDEYCYELEESRSNLILDLTQAFYYRPTNADGFNSTRKFFGVPDGGFVFGHGISDDGLPESHSFDQCDALLRRADGDLAGGYAAFKRLDAAKASWRVAKMSRLTKRLLSGIDIETAHWQRLMNFRYLHLLLGKTNLLPLAAADLAGPLVYPYLVENGAELKKKLIAEKVFCPTYWPEVAEPSEGIRNLTENLVCIPVDQRCSDADIDRIVEVIVEVGK